jgi:glycerophosphoryl diester phosphodiesterase
MDISSNSGNKIFWQAHRGGGGFEMPDNTLAALDYGWNMGAIPEVDIRLTSDNVLVCLHDNSLSRTTNAPPDIASQPIARLTFAEIRKYDAGGKFNKAYKGQKVPAFYEVLEQLQNNSDRTIYVDLKNYAPELFSVLKREFTLLVNMYEVASQIIVCSCDYELNCEIGKAIPGIKIMQWIGGSAEEQIHTFKKLCALNFKFLDQIQLHLNNSAPPVESWRYTLDAGFLEEALEICSKAGISMQVFPWQAEKADLFRLLNLGIRWFTTDEPTKFCKIIKEWQES